jgi:D-alanine-D-alanine ligase
LGKKLNVGIVFGGRSGEHEVSLRSAATVIRNLDRQLFEAVPIAISKKGTWLSPSESLSLMDPSVSKSVSKKVLSLTGKSMVLLPGRNGVKLSSVEDPASQNQSIDVIFPVLHGTYGEDGTIQGLLEMSGVPYVGCGVLASACGMDKVTMKALFRDAGLPVCKYIWFLRSDWESDSAGIRRRISRELGFPCFVKPANLGSSVGISRVDNKGELDAAIELAARYDRKIIVEEGLDAREIECGVIGNDRPESSLPGEYVVRDNSSLFLNYNEKYSKTGNVQFVVPSPLSAAQTKKIREMAVTAFRSIDGAGLARVDFFMRRDNKELLINELNTLPGLTDVSGFPQMWQATGLSFTEVVTRLLQFARDSFSEKSRNLTSL